LSAWRRTSSVRPIEVYSLKQKWELARQEVVPVPVFVSGSYRYQTAAAKVINPAFAVPRFLKLDSALPVTMDAELEDVRRLDGRRHIVGPFPGYNYTVDEVHSEAEPCTI